MSSAAKQHRWVPGRWRSFSWVFLIYLGWTVAAVWDEPSLVVRVTGFVLLGSFVAIYVMALPYAFYGGRRYAYAVPLSLSVLAVLFLVFVDGSGLLMFIYVAVALVFVLPPRASAPILTVTSAAIVFLPQYVSRWDFSGLQIGLGVPVFFTGLAMYGMRAGMQQNAELRMAREQVASLAAEQERLRIARDLHDLLGHALTTVTVKAELASRLAERDPARAAVEMREVAALARQGLADVRATVSGYREVSLVTELATAREVLRAAGMSAELPAALDTVPGDLRELFGWVVREGVTNVVRHSRAQHVRVALDGRAIEVIDDGRGSDSAPGSGLLGLRERVAAAGGRLEVHDGEPGFRLRVEVPA